MYYLTSHMKYWTDTTKELGLNEEESDILAESNWNKCFKIDTSSLEQISSPVHSELNIYTDGSKLDGRVGAAYVFYEVNRLTQENCYRLPDYCTVFQAEIKAILEAASALSREQKYKYVRIFVDSQAAIKALTSKEITSKLVLEAIQTLNIASAGRNVTIYWTKAHVGTCLLYTSPSPRD